jgi:D-alanyl-D-alanine carboxypeptidase (penicillin-binding protein 5/6)
VLVGSATRDGTRLISAVLGTRSEAARDAETAKLLDYGFSLYKPTRPVAAGVQLADPELDWRDERLSLIAERAVKISAREGQEVETEIDAPTEVSGAVEEGEALGSVLVRVDGRKAGSSPLVAAESVEGATLVDKAVVTVTNPIVLLPLGALVLGGGVLLAARGRRGRRAAEPFDPDPGAPVESPPPEPIPSPERPQPTERQPRQRRRRRDRSAQERTPEERRKMHEERMRRRRERGGGGT